MISEPLALTRVYYSYSPGETYSATRNSLGAMSDVMTALFPNGGWRISPLIIKPPISQRISVAVQRLGRYRLQRSLQAFTGAEWAMAGAWKGEGPMVLMGRARAQLDVATWETCPADCWLGYVGEIEDDLLASHVLQAVDRLNLDEGRGIRWCHGAELLPFVGALRQCGLPTVMFPVRGRQAEWYPRGWRCECHAFVADSSGSDVSAKLPIDDQIQGIVEFHVASSTP
jgi:hypothetical protein